MSAAEPLKTTRVEFPDNDRVRVLCGAHNENLKLMEKRRGVQLGLRGGQIVVAAQDEARIRMAESLVRELYELVEAGYPLYLEDVDLDVDLERDVWPRPRSRTRSTSRSRSRTRLVESVHLSKETA